MNTPDKATEIKAFLTAILAFFTALWGWLGWAVIILIACMALDWITGSWAARAHNEWSSSVARAGLWHKLGEIVALLVAALCDIAVTVLLNSAAADLLQGWTYGNYMTLLVAVWYIFTELGSIVENVDKLGAPMPGWLKKVIRFLRARADAADPIPGEPETPTAAAATDTHVGNKPEPPAPPTTGTNAKRPTDEVTVHLAIEDPAEDTAETYRPKHSAADLPDLPADIVEELPEDVSKKLLEILASGAELQGLKGPKGEPGEPGATDDFHSDR